jgi:hypothetical protein
MVRCFAALLGGAERSEEPVLCAAVEQYEERLLGAVAAERPKQGDVFAWPVLEASPRQSVILFD